MRRILALLLALGLLPGCDQLSERAGFPNPAKQAAEGKAIGGACRHAGRGLEDCYALNPTASKSAVYEGWKEMNEYMAKNNMQAIPPEIALKGKMKSKKVLEEAAGSEPEAQAKGHEATPQAKGHEAAAEDKKTVKKTDKTADKKGHDEAAPH